MITKENAPVNTTNIARSATKRYIYRPNNTKDSISLQILQLLTEISKYATITKDNTPVREEEYAKLDEEAIYAQA